VENNQRTNAEGVMRKFPVLSILILFSILCGTPTPATAAPWESKVDAWVLETADQGPTEFLVMLNQQADLSLAAGLATKAERGQFVYQVLSETARRSQPPVIAALQQMGVEYRSYWVVNALWVRGDLGIIAALAERPDVRHIYANPSVQLDAPVAPAPTDGLPEGIEWNISLVGAPEVWALGYTGQGVVVGGADTGYEWSHLAIKNQYRGWDGSTVSHDYNWYDATAVPSLTPIDPVGHGTHTMGTMVGDDGGVNQIGMAPGARWIGCRNMDAGGYGTPETYIACYQWFIAPTRVDGISDPRPDLAPDVINNSWSCPKSEGCNDPDILLAAVQAVRAAGILTTHSAGNSGPNCSTVDAPAAIYAESFTVGATTSTDTLASFSSRGPVTVDDSNRLKPDISAPGVNIRSSYKGGIYVSMSGTSMAAPHVAGLVALLISVNPALRGQVEVLESVIEQSALHLSNSECLSELPYPNNLFGWGRIQALGAALAVPHNLRLEKTASAAYSFPGDTITYTLTLSDTNTLSPATGLVLTDTLPYGTSFFSATGDYILTNNVISWEYDLLAVGQAIQVTLVVQVETAAVGEVVNEVYGAESDEALPVSGEPVITMVLRRFLLPVIVK
jgi:serine protease AprX